MLVEADGHQRRRPVGHFGAFRPWHLGSLVAHKLGDTVITLGLVKYNNEEFKQGSTIADGMPTGEQLSNLTKGKIAAYVNGWRHNGERWQVFDHHMVTIVDEWKA